VTEILHVPFTYFPDPSGGTEIYVSSLIAALETHGWRSAVAAPGKSDATYLHDGVPVFRFETPSSTGLEAAYGLPDKHAARGFRRIMLQLRPKLVHLHAYTSAVSEHLVQIAQELNAKVVFTYHTPTASCARGTMMQHGRSPCTGELDYRKCTQCVLQSRGVKWPFHRMLAAVPNLLSDAVNRRQWGGAPCTALRLSSIIMAQHQRTRSFLNCVDHVVAVCNWVADVLLLNGVPKDKLTISRQGLPSSVAIPHGEERINCTNLKLCYFGRLDPTKGVDLLTSALLKIPKAPVALDIYGISQLGSGSYIKEILESAKKDSRVKVLPPVQPSSVVQVMRNYHMVVIPSRWLETGPLVALEAFAAQRPVLGANIGGIPEIVENGVDGLLLPPDDADAWASSIAELSHNFPLIARLRSGICSPRRMTDVAADMKLVYANLQQSLR
jgi:glycosyltransferase involved in cell wall biosynthesis